jgi:hypothetical protein
VLAAALLAVAGGVALLASSPAVADLIAESHREPEGDAAAEVSRSAPG